MSEGKDFSKGSSNYFSQKAGEDVSMFNRFSNEDEDDILRDDLKKDLDSRLTSWTTFTFFVKHSFRDAGRRRFHFLLAFCSVFIVVLSTLVVNTVI